MTRSSAGSFRRRAPHTAAMGRVAICAVLVPGEHLVEGSDRNEARAGDAFSELLLLRADAAWVAAMMRCRGQPVWRTAIRGLRSK
jgi:hypothetical protein